MRILLITGIYPPDIGGPASYVPLMATALISNGNLAEVITLADDALGQYEDAYPVYRIRRGMWKPFRIIMTILKIAQAAKHTDIILANGLNTEALLGGVLTKKPVVHKIVGDLAWERLQNWGKYSGTIDEFQTAQKSIFFKFLSFLRAFPLKHCAGVLVPSKYLKGIVCGWGTDPTSVKVIYNSFDPLPSNDDIQRHNETNFFRLVTVSRLVSWKGLHGVIEAVEKQTDVSLHIVGDGPMRNELEERVRSGSAKNRIYFCGEMDKAAVYRRLKQSDVFVLNSTYEGLPHVLLEAMENGCPVIATSAGGSSEVVDHEQTGLLISPGDSNALSKAIERFKEDLVLREKCKTEGKIKVRAQFSQERMIQETIDYLKSLLT